MYHYNNGVCSNCGVKLPSRGWKYCKDSVCQKVKVEDRRIEAIERYQKRYNKKKRLCPVCKTNVTDLWPKRTCATKECEDGWKDICRVNRRKQDRERDRLKKNLKKKKAKVICIKRIPILDKSHEDYFDNDMFVAQQKELEKPNGNYCQKCSKALTGNYHNHCPNCHPRIELLANGVNDAWI
jgi:hypothetical protein